jgi:uncharacterized protein involved in exopolysaccharide biosynthesis
MAEDSQEKLEKQLASLKMQMQELTGIIETDIESSKALKGSLNDSLQGLRDELERFTSSCMKSTYRCVGQLTPRACWSVCG